MQPQGTLQNVFSLRGTSEKKNHHLKSCIVLWSEDFAMLAKKEFLHRFLNKIEKVLQRPQFWHPFDNPRKFENKLLHNATF